MYHIFLFASYVVNRLLDFEITFLKNGRHIKCISIRVLLHLGISCPIHTLYNDMVMLQI